MATQVCSDCKTTFTVARTGQARRCSKCDSRVRGATAKISDNETIDHNPKLNPETTDLLHGQPARISPPPAVRPRAEARRPAPNPSAQKLGTHLGPYEILSEIGRGGMGLVLKARDEALKRDVAIKTLLPDARANPTHELRFIQEAQIAGQLEHPGIAPVHFLSRDELGQNFFSMKLVAGESLEQILEKWHNKDPRTRAEFPLPRLLSMFERVCETIGFAHSHGVIHRDLKPANVMIGEYGEVWVLDWGLAKVLGTPDPIPEPDLEPDSKAKPGKTRGSKDAAIKATPRKLSDLDSNVTLDGSVVGTPGYMAPEQTAGEAIDEGVDIFGLGGLLYEILCGRAPFTGKTVQELLVNSARGDVKPIPRKVHGRTVPRALAAIAHKCLHFERRKRYPSTVELLRDLRAYSAGDPVSALKEGSFERLKRFARRNGRALGLAASIIGLIIAVVIVAGISVWRQDLVAREEREKRLQAEVDKKNAEAASIELERKNRQAEIDAESERRQRLQAELEKQKVLAAGAEKAQRRLNAFAPYAEAMDLLMRGQLPERAATQLRQALELDPEFEEAQYALGEALQYSGEPLNAANAYLKADELSRKIYNKPNPKALVSAGFMFDDAGNYNDAEHAFAAAESAGANDPLALVGQIFRAGHTRKLKSAISVAEEVLKKAPHLWETHFAYGYLLMESVQDGVLPAEPSRTQAIAEFNKALELSPRQAEVVSWLAISLSRVKRHQEALEWIGKAIALEPKNGNRYFQRWLLERELDPAGHEAAKDAEQARKLGIGENLRQLMDICDAIAANDFEKAFQVYSHLLKELPDWPSFYVNWAMLGFRTGHTREIQPALERWCDAHPDYYGAHWMRAEMLSKTNRTGALAEVDAGLKLAPFNAELWTLRGDLLYPDKLDDALTALNKALELNPSDFSAAGSKVAVLATLKRHEEAVALLNAMKKEFPQRTKELQAIENALNKYKAQH